MSVYHQHWEEWEKALKRYQKNQSDLCRALEEIINVCEKGFGPEPRFKAMKIAAKALGEIAADEYISDDLPRKRPVPGKPI